METGKVVSAIALPFLMPVPVVRHSYCSVSRLASVGLSGVLGGDGI